MGASDWVLIIVNAVAVAITGAWLYFRPGWESGAAFAVAVAVFVGVIIKARRARAEKDVRPIEMGKGGAAIRTGKGGKLNIKNRGDIRAGKGGAGGDGGDAIHIGDGLDVTIINTGIIAGGDAGAAAWPAVPAFVEKQVHFRYPEETGLNAQFEAEGFKAAWCNRSRVEKLLGEGWEVVQIHSGNDPPVRLCLKNSVGEDQVLMKRKM